MSVQVRRRREAAAFLSTFVGAQGELLVDTTNNRVQVHDGSTPGGWSAARIADLPGRNVVINGNFTVNQRAYASGTALSAGAYGHDRWKAGSSGCSYTFTQAVPDTAATITAGTLVQMVEALNVYATSFWLSWAGTAQARVWQGSPSGGYAQSPVLVTGLAIGATTAIEFAPGSLGLVQFEAALPNGGPTRFERRPPAFELILCQRFFSLLPCWQGAWQGSATVLTVNGSFVAPMRATPTISFVTAQAVDFELAFISVTSIASSLLNANGGYIDLNTASGATKGNLGALTTATTIYANAEL